MSGGIFFSFSLSLTGEKETENTLTVGRGGAERRMRMERVRREEKVKQGNFCPVQVVQLVFASDSCDWSSEVMSMQPGKQAKKEGE